MISEFQQLNAQVLGCSTDAAPSQKAFADHCGVSYPVVADHPVFAGAKAFGVFSEERLGNSRTTFIIDKQGVVREVLDGLQNPEDHATQALEAVKKL